MRQSDIKTNGIYRTTRPGKFRLVCGLFNGKVLYAECVLDPKDGEVKPGWLLCDMGKAHKLWNTIKGDLRIQSRSSTSTWKYHLVSRQTFARWAYALHSVRPSDHSRFLQMCRTIVDRHGKSLTLGGLLYQEERHAGFQLDQGSRRSPTSSVHVYVDDKIAIATSTATGAMFVERRENKNPVIYVNEHGISYRFHGEYDHLTPHVEARLLCTDLANLPVLMENSND